MTPQEMNLKIAEILGYYPVEYGRWAKKNEDGSIITRSSLPNYTTDKALCWDLAEMLGRADWVYFYDKDLHIHCWNKAGTLLLEVNESLLLATCEAFIEEFGKDV